MENRTAVRLPAHTRSDFDASDATEVRSRGDFNHGTSRPTHWHAAWLRQAGEGAPLENPYKFVWVADKDWPLADDDSNNFLEMCI
jgi:hypothetical protein